MTRYILVTHPEHGEYLRTYTASEMRELYTAGQRDGLDAGEAVLAGGALHVDMRLAARSATEAALEG